MSTKDNTAALKPLPLKYNLLCGGIAGVSEILCMYPLDVVKTRFQLHVGSHSNTIFGTMKDIVKTDGVSALYRGIVPPILAEAPKRAIKFGANEYYRDLFTKKFQLQDSKLFGVYTGISAGITEAIVVVSFELVKIRLQDQKSKHLYKNTWDCVQKIYKNEGPLAFMKGWEATTWRHALWNGGYFGVIGTIRQFLPEAKGDTEKLINNFVAGALGGAFGTLINTPIDVVKTRVQSQVGPHPKYNFTIPAVFTIAREEGVKALYKGFVPKVLRLGPGGGILLVVFDTLSKFIRENWI